MRHNISINVLVIVLFAVQPLSASPIAPVAIEIFIDDADHLKNLAVMKQQLAPTVDIHVYNLSAPKRFKQKLSVGLPSNPKVAKTLAMERIAKIDPETLKKKILTAYQGALKATWYGLDRLPAVVFDRGRSVVYGVTDLEAALEIYRYWQGSTP